MTHRVQIKKTDINETYKITFGNRYLVINYDSSGFTAVARMFRPLIFNSKYDKYLELGTIIEVLFKNEIKDQFTRKLYFEIIKQEYNK